MSSLSFHEKRLLESILEMGGGRVLDLSDREFKSFFSDFVIEIFDQKYTSHGPSDSKANCLRAFWDLEEDELVARVILALLALAEQSGLEEVQTLKLLEARNIAARLNPSPTIRNTGRSESLEFLQKSFPPSSFDSLCTDPLLLRIFYRRLEEIHGCFDSGAYLACVIMVGGLLEGILFGVAQKNLKEFNQSACSPKDPKAGKVRNLADWTLEHLINVACDLALLSEDIKKHCSSVRDFRNYIHPREQCNSKFQPDEHTAKISLHVLRAAIANLSGQRERTKLNV